MCIINQEYYVIDIYVQYMIIFPIIYNICLYFNYQIQYIFRKILLVYFKTMLFGLYLICVNITFLCITCVFPLQYTHFWITEYPIEHAYNGDDVQLAQMGIIYRSDEYVGQYEVEECALFHKISKGH